MYGIVTFDNVNKELLFFAFEITCMDLQSLQACH